MDITLEISDSGLKVISKFGTFPRGVFPGFSYHIACKRGDRGARAPPGVVNMTPESRKHRIRDQGALKMQRGESREHGG
jgi:hypothetical protein